jgi:DNA-3-methyladenine glycosylase
MGLHRPSQRVVITAALAGKRRLSREFFQQDPVTCARELVGCHLLWGNTVGLVVETEAYAALNDEACHTWTRPSARSFVLNHQAGSAYIYFNYGVHWMLNVLVKDGPSEGFVLMRALEPVAGIELMKRRRKRPNLKFPANDAWLCSGPGKLAKALGVTGQHHGIDLCEGANGFFTSRQPREVLDDVRIGISRAQDLRWRFLLAGSNCWSVKPKTNPQP